MTQQIINLGTAANNGTGDNLRSAMDKTNDNFTELYANTSVGSNIRFSGQTISSTNTNGNISLGPNGTGVIQIAQNVLPDADNLRLIGNNTMRPLGLYVGTAGVITKGPVQLPIFANAAVRDSTITQPITGMIVNTANVFQSYNGTSWASPASAYGDSQVTALLGNFGANLYSSTGNITTTGNISGGNILGNGSFLTGVVGNYNDANVTTLLGTLGTNVISGTGNITTTGNITGGNLLTGGDVVPDGNVTMGTGNITSQSGNIVTTSGNISGGNIITGGIISATGNITSTGNISGGNIIGIPSSITVTTAAASGDGSLAYNATTAVLTFTPADAGQSDYGDGNVTTLLAALGANAISSTATITSTANITANLLKQTSNTVGIGNLVHSTSPDGDFATAVGYRAGSLQQGFEATAIGVSSGNTNQGNAAVAVGSEAGKLNQGFKAVAIGSEAGQTSQGNVTVAVGEGAGESYQSINSIAIGVGAGARYQGQVSGSSVGGNAIAIGNDAGKGLAYFPEYISGGSGGSVTLFVDSTTGLFAGMFVVGTGFTSKQAIVSVISDVSLTMDRTAESTPSGTMSFFSPQNTGTVAIGLGAGGQDQQNDSVAIGYYAGQRQDDQAIAIGNFAGHSAIVTADFVSLADTTLTVSNVSSAIVVGMAITGNGFVSGQTIVTRNSDTEFVVSATASGVNGQLFFTGIPQGSKSIAIGQYTGQWNQATDAIAIGHEAGGENQGQYGIAIGRQTADASQGQAGIAIGFNAGNDTQGANAIAIGRNAGTVNQAANSIIINASGAVLQQTTPNTLTIDPIRNDITSIGELLSYDATTKEVKYGNAFQIAGEAQAGSLDIIGTAGVGNILTVTGNINGSNVAITGTTTSAVISATNSVKMAVFADNTARDAAITSPVAGQMVFKTDVAKLQFYNGSAWETVTSAV
jgi:hypothetical protein